MAIVMLYLTNELNSYVYYAEGFIPDQYMVQERNQHRNTELIISSHINEKPCDSGFFIYKKSNSSSADIPSSRSSCLS